MRPVCALRNLMICPRWKRARFESDIWGLACVYRNERGERFLDDCGLEVVFFLHLWHGERCCSDRFSDEVMEDWIWSRILLNFAFLMMGVTEWSVAVC